MNICPTCGAQSPEGAVFCDECGASLQNSGSQTVVQPSTFQAVPPLPSAAAIPSVQNCPVCGAPAQPGDSFCENCGASLASDLPQAPVAEVNLPPTVVIPGAVPASSDSITAPGTPVVAVPSPVPPSSPPSSLTCANCGAILEPDSAFCDMCGTPVKVAILINDPPPPEIPSPTPEVSAGSDATVVGGYGVQQDYAQPQADNFGPQQNYAATQVGEFTPPPSSEQPQIPTLDPQPSYGQSQPDHSLPGTLHGRLVIPGTNVSLPLSPGKTDLLVGREDPIGNIYPDIDLTDYGGDENGVSRQHARITLQGNQYYIIDLQSTNFTYVNQQRLAPNLPTPLNDGDEIKFGRQKMLFYQ